MAPPRHKKHVAPRSSGLRAPRPLQTARLRAGALVAARRLRLTRRIAVPALAAGLVTGTVVGTALAWPHSPTGPTGSVAAISAPAAASTGAEAETLPGSRVRVVSRSAPRVRLTEKPAPSHTATPTPTPEPEPVRRSDIEDRLFMTAPLNVWSGPGEDYTLLDVLPVGTRIPVTGRVRDGWAEVSYDGLSRWVNADYLAEKDPTAVPEPAESSAPSSSSGAITDAPCPSGSDVESGLTPDAILVHRSVCASFPEVSTYGGVRADSGEHGSGQALDIMIDSSSQGDAISEWVRAHASDLGVSQVIWAQHIWTVQRSSEGWRAMEDRGSTTANHYDHVHVTVYGSSAG
ncbi:MAG TPA: SH3 domain-containing protein [Nocardioidaceae bacterium]|nr:SH3 domain-containing protein [Nocardioidaceae bacterium]